MKLLARGLAAKKKKKIKLNPRVFFQYTCQHPYEGTPVLPPGPVHESTAASEGADPGLLGMAV